MRERFIEPKLAEMKEGGIKRLAIEMLRRFRTKFKITKMIRAEEYPHESITKKESPRQEESPAREQSTTKTKVEAHSTKQEPVRKSDVDHYESIVTNNYFEGWDDDVRLEGNPEMKGQIRQNIIEAEKKNKEKYEHAAAELGISVEEFKRRLQKKIEEVVGRSYFFIATQPHVLERIMTVDYRWKSQFETGASYGNPNPRFRAEVEKRLFGFNKDVPLGGCIILIVSHQRRC